MRKRVRILIGVLSAQKYEERREACLATWAADLADHPDIELLFLVGESPGPMPVRDGRLLYLPCPDNYRSLPQKTRWFCLWALDNYEFDYLLKCDDDTYVVLERLQDLSPAPYSGHDLGGFASGGAGYLLDHRAAFSVVGRLYDFSGAEDLLVGQVLKQGGIHLEHDPRFHPWNNLDPTPENQLITGHYCEPRRMWKIRSGLTGEPIPPGIVEDFSQRVDLAIPRVFHHIWLGSQLPKRFADFREGWRNQHPGWELKLWTEDNMPPLINQTYYDRAVKPAQKADIARYEILHRFGGVYVDTDFECLKNIEPLIGGLDGFSASEQRPLVSIGIMGAVPQHPLFARAIEEIPQRFGLHSNPVVATGPHLMTHVCSEFPLFKVFGPELFYPIHYDGDRRYPTSEAFAVHHWAMSWT